MAAVYNPQFRILSTTLCAAWLHESDAVANTPKTALDSFDHDTGRLYAYVKMDSSIVSLGNAPGDVDAKFYDDFFSRVALWKVDESIYFSGSLPTINISPGSPLYPASIDIAWVSVGNETFGGITLTGTRLGFKDKEGLLPCGTPLSPGAADMDLVIAASSQWDDGVNPILYITMSFKFRGSIPLRYPDNTAGETYFPYELIIAWNSGDDAVTFGGGWTTIYPGKQGPGSDIEPTFDSGNSIEVCFETNNPQFGSSAKVDSTFAAYSYNWTGGAPGDGYVLPDTQYDPTSFTGSFPILLVPDDVTTSGEPYFEYQSPDGSGPIFSASTGQRTTAGPMPMRRPPS